MSYTLAVSGSVFTAKNPSGGILYQGSSALAALSALWSNVPADGSVVIYGGAYPSESQSGGGKNNVTVSADLTAIINATAAMGYIFLWAGSSGSHLNKFTLSNLKFDGGRTTSYPDTGTDGNSAGPAIRYVDHVVVDGITIQNLKRNPPTKGADGLNIGGATGAPVTDIEVKNSNFRNIYGSGIAAAYLNLINLHDCDFVDCAQWYPIGGAVYVGDEVGNVTVARCNISGHTDNDGIYVGTSRSLATNVLITRNTINLRLYWKGGADYTDVNGGNPAAFAGSGIKLYSQGGEISKNDINLNNTSYDGLTCYVGCISLWGQGVNAFGNVLRNAKYGIGSWVGVFDVGNHNIQGNLIIGNIIGVNLEQSGCTVNGNKFVNNGTDIQGTPQQHVGNLYDKTASDRRKLTTSSNLNSPLIMQGFELAVNEICYTEQGSTIIVGAKVVDGYTLSAFSINGVDYAPDVNGQYGLTVGARDYTVQAILVPSTPPQTFKLTLSTTTGGSTSMTPGVIEYQPGSVVSITALPSTGYKLDHWELDGAVSTVNPISVTMNANHTLLAVFALLPTPTPSHVLVVTTIPITAVPIVVNGQNYSTPTPPLTLQEGSYPVSVPSNVLVGSDTYNFSQWNDGSTNPQRIIPLTADTTITASYVKVQPPLAKGRIEIHSFMDAAEVVASGVIVETGQTFQTPSTTDVDPGNYTVRVTLGAETQEQSASVVQDQTIRLDFPFKATPRPSLGTGVLTGGVIVGLIGEFAAVLSGPRSRG